MKRTEHPSLAREEHEILRRRASDLRRTVEGWPCGCGADGACRCFLESLEGFRRSLNDHFENEEREWAAADNVDWSSRYRIGALKQEHESLRERLARVSAALLDLTDRGARPTPLLRSETHGILDDLLRHELSEAGLSQRLMFNGSVDFA
jgi:hypothetical protein